MVNWEGYSLDKNGHFFLIFLTGLTYAVLGDSLQDVSAFKCTFDIDLCGWTQDNTDDFDWERHRGITPTHDTGPSMDHTNGNGYYMYARANNHRNKSARLISPEINSGKVCFTFWYNMYGADMGTLVVYPSKEEVNMEVFKQHGNQWDFWKQSIIEVRSSVSFQVVIESEVRDDAYYEKGDIAIDDTYLTSCQLDCAFEDGTCAWRFIPGNYNWELATSDFLKDSFIYIYVARTAGTAKMQSAYQEPGTQCVSILLRILGNKNNSLDVFIERKVENDGLTLIRSISNKNNQDMPFTALTELIEEEPYRVLLAGNVYSGDNENIHIIQITTIMGLCPKDCDSNPCSNGATCKQNTDATYKCECSEGWTGQHCIDVVRTTDAPLTAGTTTSNGSSTSKDEEGGIIEDPSDSHTDRSRTLIVHIIVPVVSCLVVVIGIAGIFLYLWRQRKNAASSNEGATPGEHDYLHCVHNDVARAAVDDSVVYYSTIDEAQPIRTEEMANVEANATSPEPDEHNVYTPLDRHEYSNENAYMPLIHRQPTDASVDANQVPVYMEVLG